MPVQGNKQERKLLKVFKSLDNVNKESLLAFAEFLQSRTIDESVTAEDNIKNKANITNEPLDIERPEEESVIKAIKRLTNTYPMVNKENILNPISGVMTSHIMQGKSPKDAIDELETLFLNEYNSNNTDDQ